MTLDANTESAKRASAEDVGISIPERLLNAGEVADLLHISDRTLRKMVAEEELTSFKIRGSVRFSPDAVRTLLLRAARGKTEGYPHACNM